jgi:hypothetical protein
MSATAEDMKDSPNPDFNRPINKDPDQVRAECYDHHRRAGTLGTFYLAYPGSAPWDYGLTPRERAGLLGDLQMGRER